MKFDFEQPYPGFYTFIPFFKAILIASNFGAVNLYTHLAYAMPYSLYPDIICSDEVCTK